jgi:hypothetical protein
MTMRLELHLFLWVTAGLAVLLQLTGGILLSEKVVIEQSAVRVQLVVDDTEMVENDAVSGRIAKWTEFALYDKSVRPMFSVNYITLPVAPAEFAAEPQTVPPVLKGVLGGDGGRKAVFTLDPAGADYIAVGVGETVSDYRIEAIGQDFVTAVSPAGEEVRFELRGAGEGN